MDESVSGRVRTVITAARMSYAAFAARVGITPDKLSKSLNGIRRFSSTDLALIAEAGSVTVDWLLTGRQLRRAGVAGRGDAAAHSSSLSDIAERFTAAYEVLELLGRAPEMPTLPEVGPGDPDEQGEQLAATVRAWLGQTLGPGEPLATDPALLPTGELLSVIERAFGVDFAVVELPGLVDGFSWQQEGGPRLALARRDDRWTRQRFTLAHELGHLLAGDAAEPRTESPVAPGHQAEPDEVRANAFAAALLMPEADIRRAAAQSGPESAAKSGADFSVDFNVEFAELVVRFRVSPSALAARLRRLGLIDASQQTRLRRRTTAECHLAVGAMDAYLREAALAEAERPPARLAEGLYLAFRSGETTLRPLAALLGVEPKELEDDLLQDDRPQDGAVERDGGELVYQP
ncbi:Zn-dependent peptidase ImmA (M78 family)/transcriptional regulator with XRE-family HTH domain [Streptacidiphilus sp. BW17]|jgi:Zn-dependent peptidase ImmA (M78 family)/transcriptional regulator with XRE-family HTH domain|uniref:ImmA/IrrE family metallo-endopeptidase n=1 Tax=Streptacidiphilus sp. BW17 TaxID=3156274 RepID=UPI003512BA70